MHSCRVFNVSGKFILGEFSKTKVLLYKRSWVTLSVTSRREISRRDVKKTPLCHVATWITTSRRQFLKHLSRRDVKFSSLCHVATWFFTSRRQIVRLSVTSRRGILTSRRGLLTSRRHFYTSRRHLVTYSVTSRREPPRRDVIWTCSLPRRDVAPHVATSPNQALCHVATWPRTSRRETVFNPRIGHFWPFTAPTLF